MRLFLIVALSVFWLGACGLGPDLSDEKNLKLEGERLDVLVQRPGLEASYAAKLKEFGIPPAFANENWSQYLSLPHHVPEHLAVPKTIHRAWTRSIGAGSGKSRRILNPPVINAGRLFALNTNGEVVAISAKSGKSIWRKKLKVEEEEHIGFTGGLAVLGDYLFVTTGSGEVFALSASSGEEVWKVDVEAPIRAAPVVVKGRVIVVTLDNHAFVFNAADGALLWTHSGIGEGLALLGGAPPASDGDVVAIPYSSGEVFVLQLSDGKYLWHDALTMNVGADPFAGLVDIEAAPVIANKVLYGVNFNGQLGAFDLETGRRLWTVPASANQAPWVAGTAVFIVTTNNELAAINRVDGSVRWVTPLDQFVPKDNPGRFWVGPVLAGERLMVASSDGYAVSVEPENGEKLFVTHLVKGSGVSVPPIVALESLYFLTDDGDIVTFR